MTKPKIKDNRKETNIQTSCNEELDLAADQLLEYAMKYWEIYNKIAPINEMGAVVWLEHEDGRLIIFTRGEYKWQLMQNIQKVILEADGELIQPFI